MLQKFLYFGNFLLILMTIAACGKKEKQPAALHIAFNVQPTTTDPRLAGDFASSTLICMIYEGLTRCLPGGNVELALAESVEISSDGLTYLFHLRDAVWSDGTPITAHQFEKSWKEILHPPGISAYLFYPIKNGEKCVRGEIGIDQVGILALDDKTLQVELEHPTPYFYSLTAFPSFLPAPPSPASYSGPFCIDSHCHNSEIILVKNETCWRPPTLDEVHIHIIPDEMTALQMFEKGELDWLGGPLSPLPPDAFEKIEKQVLFIPNSASTLCTFNTESGPFSNIHLRKAFAYAIHRDEIVTQVTQAGQVSPHSILPPQLSHHPCNLYDLEKAKSCFALALQELNISKESLNDLILYYKQGQIERRLAQTLQRQWKEALGVELQLIQLDAKSHMARLQTKDYQIALANWIAQFDDPISILERFKTKKQLKNYPGWESGQYMRLLTASKAQEGREEILSQLESILEEEVPLTPIYHWRSPALCGPRIKTFGTTPSGGVLFERFQLNEP